MNDLKQFKHGEEGTHYVCPKHNIGGKSLCCHCTNKTDCSALAEQKEESWEDELERLQLTDDGIDRFCCSKNYLKFFIQTQKDISYKEGRKSVLDEIKHDQRKMLDGFSHPKSCEQCFLIKEK